MWLLPALLVAYAFDLQHWTALGAIGVGILAWSAGPVHGQWPVPARQAAGHADRATAGTGEESKESRRLSFPAA
jgi:hypothetical protein